MTKIPSVDDLYDLPPKARNRLTERNGVFVVDPAAGQAATSASGAIQSKIGKAAAFGGGIVVIPPGLYPIGTTLTVPSGVTIEGSGRGVTILRNMDNVNTSVIKQSVLNTVDVTLRDMTVDGKMAAQTLGVSVIRIDSCYRWVFSNLEVLGGKRIPGDPLGLGECIELLKGGHHKIIGCYVHDTDYDGVKLRTSHYNIITNLHAHNCGKSGVQIAYAKDLGEAGYPSTFNLITGLTVTHETGIPGNDSPSTTGVTFHAGEDTTIVGMMVDGTMDCFNAAAITARNTATGVEARVRSVHNDAEAFLDLARATVVNARVRSFDNTYVSPTLIGLTMNSTLRVVGPDLIFRTGGADTNLTP